MLTARHQVVKDAAKAKDIDFVSPVRILVCVLALVEDDLGWLPADTTLHGVSMVAVHLRVELLRQAHVRELDLQESVDEDVVWLNVAVHDVVLV